MGGFFLMLVNARSEGFFFVKDYEALVFECLTQEFEDLSAKWLQSF
jgi:hypothetical protein